MRRLPPKLGMGEKWGVKVDKISGKLARVKQPAISQDDSLELSCLDDSLDEVPHSKYPNTTMSRGGRNMESLTSTAADLCLDSAKRPLPSSTKRRRTTQVINITMTQVEGICTHTHQKTPGLNETDDTFYSLPSARSQPNLSSTHASRPISMEPLDPPADMATGGSSGQLGNLPGYRRSTAHPLPPRSSGTFCVGTENEPDLLGDWVIIAQLQARNQACLPHLKSSYPLESRPSLGPDFIITDEDLRLGDPSETIRRASLMPGQYQDSLTGHRYMPGHTAGPASRGHSLMPETSSAFSQQHSPRPKGQTSSALLRPSPQTKASFPTPLRPKRNTRSPASFTIENTPRKKTYLRKGLDKLLRSSTLKPSRKSPCNGAAAKSRTTTTQTTKSPRTAKSPSLAAKIAEWVQYSTPDGLWWSIY